MTIELRHTGDRVRTAVIDDDRRPKPPLAASPESGRGLRLVEARGRLGNRGALEGKAVWTDVTFPYRSVPPDVLATDRSGT